MTETRPYSGARSVDGHRQELRACSGTQFDPAVVTAFLGVLDRRPPVVRAGDLAGVAR